MKIAFHSTQLCVRGSSVAMYDYAHCNETILFNKSVIVLLKEGLDKSDKQALSRFQNRFEILLYDKGDLDRVLITNKVNLLYCIKYGTNDNVFSTKIKTVVHCVFDMSQPHGDVYAGVSESLSKKFNSTLFVPHMIRLKPDLSNNLRQSLSIPENTTVFGRYGGMDTFDLTFCMDVIRNVVEARKDIFFLFINTPVFVNHKQVLFLENITEERDKNAFISTCDAHLECGSLGHSFGLAIGEFSVHNKPIIAYKSKSLWNTCHLDILGNKGIYFETKDQFENILLTFDKKVYSSTDNNCYKNYSPTIVMNMFKSVFIDS